MELYLDKVFSEEDGLEIQEGKTAIINGSKEKILELCEFFEKVKKHMQQSTYCHMQFRDYNQNWNKKEYIDIEVNVPNQDQ